MEKNITQTDAAVARLSDLPMSGWHQASWCTLPISVAMPTPESFHTKASAWHLRRSDWRRQSGSTKQRQPKSAGARAATNSFSDRLHYFHKQFARI